MPRNKLLVSLWQNKEAMESIVGRKKEQKELEQVYNSNKAEFVVVYGRRRVGKTYLVREFFQDRLDFYHTALSPIELEDENLVEKQLQAFYHSLKRYGAVDVEKKPVDWFDAFEMLITLLESKGKDKRLVVFIDELPWMDTPRSGFITAFEHFWNGWAAGQKHIMLIVCGSATSWISDKLLQNKGGLYGRTTYEMHLSPFTLGECEEYMKSEGIIMDRYEQLQCYMAMGGIPYYLSYINKGESLTQNIDRLFFDKKGKLRGEFDRLYASLFTTPEKYIKIIKLLSQKREGYTREEIAKETGLPYGGGLTKMLRALESSDFIMPYVYYNHSVREVYYKLTDLYTLFYLYFIDKKNAGPNYWKNNLMSPALNAWRGFAFEEVCFVHREKIKQALGIAAVQAEISPWRSKSTEGDRAQIDMLIDRADRVVNVCEMKYSTDDYTIDKKYDAELRRKLDVFANETKCRKALHTTLVTTYGLAKNEYSGRIQNVVTMDSLFD